MTRRKTWALVSNGVRVRILRDLEDDSRAGPDELIAKAPSTHLRQALSDNAGFGSNAVGPHAALAPGSDPILRDMRDFARDTLSLLDGHLRAGRLDRLAIFAAPRMLAILRQKMPPSLRAAVCLERGLDLIGLPEAELREFIVRTLEEEAPS